MSKYKINAFLKNIPLPTFLLFVGATISIFWSLHFARVILATPYQIGLREGAPQVITQMLMDGKNFSTLENLPLSYYVYGIGYNLAVLPFARLFGNTLHIHRLVSFSFILLSSTLGFWIVYQERRKFSLALACSAFFMTAFMGWGGIGSAPSTMGTFLFLAALFIPYLWSFNTIGIILSVFFALAAFHTKAYFVLSFGIVAVYLFLFVSKKKALVYVSLFAVLFFIAFAIIQAAFPLYFVILFLGNASYVFRTLKHLYTQLFWLVVYFAPALILAMVMLFGKSRKKTSSFSKTQFKYNFSSLDAPLIEFRPDYYLVSFLLSLTAFVLILGSHVGNYLAYSYELVVSTFILWLLINFDIKKGFRFYSAATILLNLFLWQHITLNPKMLEQKSSFEWEKMFSYLDPSLNILNSPAITSRLIEMDMQTIDSGQTDYFYTMQPFPDNPMIGPSYEEFFNVGQEYKDTINQAIIAQEYDLIVTTKDTDMFYDLKLVEANYEMIDQLILYMQQTEQKWVLQIWEPRR